MGLERAFERSFDHHRLALALMAERADLLDRLARRARNLLGRDFGAADRAPHARVEVDHLASISFEMLAQEARFLLLGVLRGEQQHLGPDLRHHPLSLMESS